MDGLTYRAATEADLPFLDALADADEVGSARDGRRPDHREQQCEALRAIAVDPNIAFYVVEHAGEKVASFQLAFIPGISRRGAWRGQIESVFVLPEWRGRGVGEAMMRWAIARCRERGCGIVQLTSDNKRPGAHRFYARLGFAASHTGFKLKLD